MSYAPYSDELTYDMCGGATADSLKDIVQKTESGYYGKANAPILNRPTGTTPTSPVDTSIKETTDAGKENDKDIANDDEDKTKSFFNRMWESYQAYIIAFIVIVVILIIIIIALMFSGGSSAPPPDYGNYYYQ